MGLFGKTIHLEITKHTATPAAPSDFLTPAFIAGHEGQMCDLSRRHTWLVRCSESMREENWSDEGPNVEQTAYPRRSNLHPRLGGGRVYRSFLPLTENGWTKRG